MKPFSSLTNRIFFATAFIAVLSIAAAVYVVNKAVTAEAEVELKEHLDQASKALHLAQLRYEHGYSAYLEVLDAERTYNDAQLLLIRNRQNYLSYTVDLMNALGGGWTPA